MDRKLLAIVAVGTVVILLSAWLAYPVPQVVPEKERHYLHCPKCLRELAYSPERAARGCPRCGEHQKLVPTRESLAKTGHPPAPLTRILAVAVIEVNLLLLVLIGYSLYTRRRSPNDEYLYMECSHCEQKLRYRAARIGQVGQCPRCKHRLVFPLPAAAGPAPRFWQPRWWQDRWQRSRSWWQERRNSA